MENYNVKIKFSCRTDDRKKLEQKLGSIIMYNIHENINVDDDAVTLTVEKEETKWVQILEFMDEI